MTLLLTGLPGVNVWIPSAWDAWTLWGIDYRRALAGIEVSTDGRTWTPLSSRVAVHDAIPHPVTDAVVRHV